MASAGEGRGGEMRERDGRRRRRRRKDVVEGGRVRFAL